MSLSSCHPLPRRDGRVRALTQGLGSWSTGIRTLPMEMLARIFSLIVDDYSRLSLGSNFRIRRLAAMLILSWVCRYWRSTLHAFPLFRRLLCDDVTISVNRLCAARETYIPVVVHLEEANLTARSFILHQIAFDTEVIDRHLDGEYLVGKGLTHLSISAQFRVGDFLPAFVSLLQNSPALEVLNFTAIPCSHALTDFVEELPVATLDCLRYLSIIGDDRKVPLMLECIRTPPTATIRLKGIGYESGCPAGVFSLLPIALGDLSFMTKPSPTTLQIELEPRFDADENYVRHAYTLTGGGSSTTFWMQICEDQPGLCLRATLGLLRASAYFPGQNIQELWLGPVFDIHWTGAQWPSSIPLTEWWCTLFKALTGLHLVSIPHSPRWRPILRALTSVSTDLQTMPCPLLTTIHVYSCHAATDVGYQLDMLWSTITERNHSGMVHLQHLHYHYLAKGMSVEHPGISKLRLAVEDVTWDEDWELHGMGQAIQERLEEWDDYMWTDALPFWMDMLPVDW